MLPCEMFLFDNCRMVKIDQQLSEFVLRFAAGNNLYASYPSRAYI